MQDIQTQAINNYQNNLEFFRTSNEIVYNKLIALETLLEDKTFSPKYDLIYENGYFDVLEIASGAKLYNINSNTFSENIVNNISLKKNDQSFRSKRKINFEEKSFQKIKNANSYTTFANTAEIYELYHNNTDDSTHMTEIDKFIFLGVGLGLHIPKAVKKFGFQLVLIVEDNLELFRLSLFTVDYKKALEGTTSYFSIADNAMEFRNRFNGFYLNAFFKNHYIKFHLFSSVHEYKIEEIQAILIGRPEATYSHNRILEKSRKVLERIDEEYKFLDLRKKAENTYFEDKPWLVLGAGPSLYNNADWIVENQDKFIIIAAFTALNTLKRIGVKPDIAVQVDENVQTTHEMIKKLDDLSFLDDTLLFFTGSVSPELFTLFEKENIYLHEDRTKYKLSKSTLTVSSVGDTIHALALIYNASNIYLLGIDLALSDDGKSHSPDHFKSRVVQNNGENKEKSSDFQLGDTILQIKGNFKDKVNSTPLFILSIPVINQFTMRYKAPNQTIYNLSDGCFLEQTVPLHTNKVKIEKNLKKETIRKDIKEFFDKQSTTKLDDKEIDGLACREGQIKDYYQYLEEFKNAPHINFLGSLITMVSNMCNHSCSFELRDLITIYFLNTTSYADDFFNTQELKNSKKFTKKFKSIFAVQVERIIKTYDEDLHRVKILKQKLEK
jgi:hypothetical protein